MILSRNPLVGPLFQSLVMEISLHPRSHCPERHVGRSVVTQLPLHFPHVLDLVRVGIRARAQRLVVLDPEIDPLD